jgi:hypothetical protein
MLSLLFYFLPLSHSEDASSLIKNTPVQNYEANEKPLCEVLLDMTLLVREAHPDEEGFCIRLQPSPLYSNLKNLAVTFTISDSSVLTVLRLLCDQIPGLAGVPPVRLDSGRCLLWRQMGKEIWVYVGNSGDIFDPRK